MLTGFIIFYTSFAFTSENINYGFSSTIIKRADISSLPEKISIFSHIKPSPMPNGKASGFTFELVCQSDCDPFYGACDTSPENANTHVSDAENISLLFTEQRTGDQVVMPGLQVPVVCVPWPIKIKLLPFDLSRQPAGHYSGTLSLTFTPSLD
ncbi:CfaE/CblD family pilus tip adhesin [Salmonella enterica subsp. diarizonae serovar 65:(k):z]